MVASPVATPSRPRVATDSCRLQHRRGASRRRGADCSPEPILRSNVLSSETGDVRDETSVCRGRDGHFEPAAIFQLRNAGQPPDGSISRRSGRDGATRGAAVAGGSDGAVDAGRQPGEMAPCPYHLVLGAIPARPAQSRLHAVPSRLRLPVQLLLRQRRPEICPCPARPHHAAGRRGDHRLSPARRCRGR